MEPVTLIFRLFFGRYSRLQVYSPNEPHVEPKTLSSQEDELLHPDPGCTPGGYFGLLRFDGISTGPLEGMNNKIGLLQRRAYGFSDMEFFKLTIMALHEATAVLIG